MPENTLHLKLDINQGDGTGQLLDFGLPGETRGDHVLLELSQPQALSMAVSILAAAGVGEVKGDPQAFLDELRKALATAGPAS